VEDATEDPSASLSGMGHLRGDFSNCM